MKTIVVIGGGPSGMMAAISSKIHHKDSRVILLERNPQLGNKLKLTGGGRCNVTADVTNDVVIENTPKNGKFLYSALSQFGPKEIIDFFQEEGCILKIEDHKRVFPKSNRSDDIINTLQNKLRKLNIDIRVNTFVEMIDSKNSRIYSSSGVIYYDHLIIATGGRTYPLTGSDGNGYTLAKSLGHTITDLLPGEVPLVTNDRVIQEKILQGLSFSDVSVKIMDNKKVIKIITHDLIITHFGLSGPAALRASFYVQKLLENTSSVKILIDFLPNITFEELNNLNESELDEYLIKNGLPKRLISFLKQEYKQDMILHIKNFPMSIYSTRGFSQAFVTNGGVTIKEIDPRTMKSKLVSNVSFCGEIIDISSFTGGFNITSAFSTGYIAGRFSLESN